MDSSSMFLHLLGGSLLSCVSSNSYNLGMLIPYFVSFYYQTDKSVSSSSFMMIMGLTGISETLGNLLISQCLKYLSPHRVIIIFGSISSLMLFFSCLIVSPQLFCWVYGIAVGLQTAGLFLPTVYILWNRYPHKKGFILGFCLAFFNLGIIPFGYLFTITANPLDLAGFKITQNTEEVIFDERVTSRIPWTIQLTSLSYLAATFIGVAFLPSIMIEKVKENEVVCLNYKDILKNLKFWNIFLMMTCGLSASLYIHNLYKVIGLMSIESDHLNSFIGMGYCVSNGIANFFFGYLLNTYDWKKIMVVNYLILMLLMGTLWFTLESALLYAAWVFLSGLFGGSIYTSVVLLSEIEFPKDHRALSCVCLSLILVYFSPYWLETFVTPVFGYFYTFIFICVMYGVTIVQVIIHPRTIKKDTELRLLDKN